MSKVSFKGGEITYKYLFNKSKHDLCVDYLSLLDAFKKLQKAEHNSEYKQCEHAFVMDISCGRDILVCSKCGEVN